MSETGRAWAQASVFQKDIKSLDCCNFFFNRNRPLSGTSKCLGFSRVETPIHSDVFNVVVWKGHGNHEALCCESWGIPTTLMTGLYWTIYGQPSLPPYPGEMGGPRAMAPFHESRHWLVPFIQGRAKGGVFSLTQSMDTVE